MNASQLTMLISPVVETLGLECLGVEFGQHSSNSLLRVYIDALERAVTVEDCELVSREISSVMDVNDPISGRYTLEVSSPGFDRPLFVLEHYARFVGQTAKISVNLSIGGRRRFQGEILRVENSVVVIDQDGTEVAIDYENIEKGKLAPDFNEPKSKPKPRSPSRAGKSPARHRKK